jgi:hypothetical protein
MKQNCWEFKKCGREPGGSNVDELGACPASTETKVDGVHGGKNAGRCCWAVAGTLCCEGKVEQGTSAMKSRNCLECDFYKNVQKEEKSNFIFTARIFDKLKP